MVAPVPVPVNHTECGEIGSDDPVTGKPQCILARQVTQLSAQSTSDQIYDSKVNPYETFENPPLPLNRFVFLYYVVFFLVLLCIVPVFTSTLSAIRKNTLLSLAFLLILLLAILQKRDGT
jgi:hypothetical protein